MKIKLLVLLVFIFGTNCTNKYATTSVQNKEYLFQYYFLFTNEDDTSSFIVEQIATQIPEKNNLVGLVCDNLGKPIPFTTLEIMTTNKQHIQFITVDSIGKFATQLPPAKYLMRINHIGYDNFGTQLEIVPHAQTAYKINLGLGTDLTVYRIYSKRKLDEKEVLAIKNCVKQSQTSPINCEKKGDYYIMIDI